MAGAVSFVPLALAAESEAEPRCCPFINPRTVDLCALSVILVSITGPLVGDRQVGCRSPTAQEAVKVKRKGA